MEIYNSEMEQYMDIREYIYAMNCFGLGVWTKTKRLKVITRGQFRDFLMSSAGFPFIKAPHNAFPHREWLL